MNDWLGMLRWMLFLIGSGPVWAAPVQTVESRVDAVTVYDRGATVTRTAEVSIEAGESLLRFAGLSAAVERQRLQISVQGTEVVLGQIRVDRIQQQDAVNDQVVALQQDIAELEQRLMALDDSTSTAQLKLKFLEGLAQGYAKESWFEGARGQADINSWRLALQVLDEGASQARQTIRANGVSKTPIERKLSQARRSLQQLQGQHKVSSDVVVSVTAKERQTVEVRLSYFQRDATWSAQYVVNLDSSTGQLQMQQHAQVQQNTDEDWSNVALTLTTSRPGTAMQAPTMESEFIDLLSATGDADYARRLGAPPALAEAGLMSAQASKTASDAPNLIEVGRYAVTYRVAGRVNVANSQAQNSRFELTQMNFVADLVTRIVPRSSATAFLVAKYQYDGTLPLLAGNLMVYVDQVYVGETWLPRVLPQAEVALPVGQDQRVTFVVRDQGGGKGERGLIGRRQQVSSEHLFDIANRSPVATMIEVFDRYPTAVNDDVEFTIPRTATPPTDRDVEDRPGVVVWRKTLDAGATWQITHAYEMSYPVGRTLVGARP